LLLHEAKCAEKCEDNHHLDEEQANTLFHRQQHCDSVERSRGNLRSAMQLQELRGLTLRLLILLLLLLPPPMMMLMLPQMMMNV
jgi:hypothetical protein